MKHPLSNQIVQQTSEAKYACCFSLSPRSMFLPRKKDWPAGGAAVAGIGLLSTIASIPLFIASGKNKRKTINMTANIKMEKATIFERQSYVQSSYPAIAFKIDL